MMQRRARGFALNRVIHAKCQWWVHREWDEMQQHSSRARYFQKLHALTHLRMSTYFAHLKEQSARKAHSDFIDRVCGEELRLALRGAHLERLHERRGLEAVHRAAEACTATVEFVHREELPPVPRRRNVRAEDGRPLGGRLPKDAQPRVRAVTPLCLLARNEPVRDGGDTIRWQRAWEEGRVAQRGARRSDSGAAIWGHHARSSAALRHSGHSRSTGSSA